MSAINYASLAGPSGAADNMGGTTSRCYFAGINDFLSIKTPTASPSTLADLVSISTAHTFKTGKCFKLGYCTQDKGKFDAKTQGEADGRSFKQEFEFFLPGSAVEAHGFAAQAKNDNFIFLVEMPDSADSGYIQVGTEMFPATVAPEFTSATNASGVRGHVFKVSAMSNRTFIYDSTITLTPAS